MFVRRMGEATKSAKGNKQEGNIVCGEIGVEIKSKAIKCGRKIFGMTCTRPCPRYPKFPVLDVEKKFGRSTVIYRETKKGGC